MVRRRLRGFGDVFSCFYNRFVSTEFFIFQNIFCWFGALIRSIKHRRSVLEICWRSILQISTFSTVLPYGTFRT